jgi:enamine deaminase RidA (YjgF/YER057c/UK114 family)
MCIAPNPPHISGILEDAGSNLQKIIKANIYLTSMSDFGAMNKAYLEFFPDYLPVSITCGEEETSLPDRFVRIGPNLYRSAGAAAWHGC